jgi:alpha-beta hydrolase superfamily lysophospholipase
LNDLDSLKAVMRFESVGRPPDHRSGWIALCAALGMCAIAGAAAAAPEVKPCPEGVAPGTRCLTGRDDAGAYYWLAVPKEWNGTLVVHAHGGPELGKPKAERPAADLKRWSIWTRAGYAYAGSGFRQGGVEVRAAAEDTERVRGIFIAEVGMPKRTILHGQSWGASVAARAAEMFTASSQGKAPYDAVLLTSGVLGGGTHSYDFRLDLRVVYQAVCGNHPRPDEAAYPLWEGLPPDAKLTRAELAARVDECTGVKKKPEERTVLQQRNLKTITDVVRIRERSLLGHLNWGTWHFQDIVFRRLGGRNPFGNEGVRYGGSPDDDALNARVARYRADPDARAAFGADTDPQGRIPVPVLTVHAIDDPIAFVELESYFRETMTRAGTAGHLVQTFTDDHEHSYLSDAQYVAAMRSLIDWVERGEKPSAQSVAARCQALEPSFDPGDGCRFRPQFVPQPLATRVPAR